MTIHLPHLFPRRQLPIEERIARALCAERLFETDDGKVCAEHAKQARALMAIVGSEIEKRDDEIAHLRSQIGRQAGRFRLRKGQRESSTEG